MTLSAKLKKKNFLPEWLKTVSAELVHVKGYWAPINADLLLLKALSIPFNTVSQLRTLHWLPANSHDRN